MFSMTLAMAFSMVLAMSLVIAAPQIGTSLALYCTPGPLRVCIISSFLAHLPRRHAASISMLAIMLSAPSRHHRAAIAENNTCQQNDYAFIHFYLPFLSSFPIAICCYVITTDGVNPVIHPSRGIVPSVTSPHGEVILHFLKSTAIGPKSTLLKKHVPPKCPG
jgi:hypothetical protein